MLTFLLLNGAVVAVALLVVRAVASDKRASLALLTGLSAYLVLVHTAMLAAGLAGRLTVGGTAVALAIALSVAGWCASRVTRVGPNPSANPTERVARRGASERGAPATRDAARFTAAELFPSFVAAAAGVVWAWPHVFEATRLWIWDDYTYHMVYPALWLREHAIAAPTPASAFTMQAWYPLSASVIASWFMLPFAHARGEALAWVSVAGLLYAGIVACATAELLARLGCRRGAWAVPVVLLLTSHRVAIMASSFSDADLAQATALFAALVFAVPRGDEESSRDVHADAWFAALLSGLAIGVKVSAAPVAVIVALVVVIRGLLIAGRGVNGGWRRGARTALVFALAWGVTGAYWYARDWWHTGNPLYPAAFLFWPGATFPYTTLREYGAHYGLTRAVRDALAVYLNWPLAHALLAVVGLLGIGVIAVRTRARRYFAIAAVVVTVVVIGVLPSAPYSAGNSMTFVSGFIHWDSMRYVALLPLLGWAALGALLDAGAGAPRWRTLVAIAVTAGAVLTSGLSLRHALVVLGLGIVAAVIASRVGAEWLRTTTGRRVAVATAMIVIAVIVVSSHGVKASATASAIHQEPLFGAAAAVLDREAPGTRVAVFGDQWIYPTFGDRGHLLPVRVDANGRIATLPIGGDMTPGPLAVDAATFGANLRAGGIGLVVIVHMPHPGRDPAWPTQHAGLQAVAGASRVYEDRAVSVWRLDSSPR